MRYLGLDFGNKTVGVAISDELNMMAHPMETIYRERSSKLRKTLSRIKEIVDEKNITHIVLGYPLMPSGDELDRCKLTKEFAEELRKKLNDDSIKIIYVDERYTTYIADDILYKSGIDKKDRKKHIDQIAAGLILETYLGDKNA